LEIAQEPPVLLPLDFFLSGPGGQHFISLLHRHPLVRLWADGRGDTVRRRLDGNSKPTFVEGL
jgi:hypothetical protein